FLDQALQRLLGWKLGHLGDAAELPHRRQALRRLVIDDQRALPESEYGVFLEGRHAGQEPVIGERGRAPLDRLFDVRTDFVHDFAQVLENGAREGSGFCNVGVDTTVTSSHVALGIGWRKRWVGGGIVTGLQGSRERPYRSRPAPARVRTSRLPFHGG